jgi:hypothetical protein
VGAIAQVKVAPGTSHPTGCRPSGHNLEDVYDRKYLEIDQVRQQYPHVVQSFRTAAFPPELVTGLITALRDLGDRPLIVRSSSLLEDRTGAVFSGKYKSLFLANRGSEAARLQALQDAIAEVYASIFSPTHRAAPRNLLDVHEEMGIMIQEVVGRQVGRYFLPRVRWCRLQQRVPLVPRIRREDGLIRLVPGLGTRAVDRLTDEYPVLLAPGKQGCGRAPRGRDRPLFAPHGGPHQPGNELVRERARRAPAA